MTETAQNPDDPSQDGDGIKVCYCMRVHERTLRRAIAAGARDLQSLQDLTRAGTGCGTCRIDLLALLRECAGRSDPARAHVALLAALVAVAIAVWLSFALSGVPTVPTAATAPADPTPAPAPRSTAPAGEIRGRVVDALGRALSGASITLEAMRRGDWLLRSPSLDHQAVRSGPDGRFALTPPTGGELCLTVAHDEFPPIVAATELRVTPGHDLEIGEITLASALGVVVQTVSEATGRAIGGARLTLEPSLVDRRLGPRTLASLARRTTADAAGRAVFHGVARGVYRLRVEAPDAATVQLAVDRSDAARPMHLRVALPQGELLRGRVESPQGVAVGGVTVVVRSARSGVETLARSSDAGDFRLAGLAPGSYALWAWSPQGAIHVAELSVPCEPMRLALAPPCTVRGEVVDADSRAPIAGARVSAGPSTPWPDALADATTPPAVRADHAGRFEIAGVPAGRIDLRAASDGHVSQRAGPFAATTQSPPMVIELSAEASLSGRIVDPTGRALAGAELQIMPPATDATDFAALVAAAAPRSAEAPSVRSAPDGRFRIGGLADVALRLRVQAPGHATLLTGTLRPTARGTNVGDLRLRPGAIVAGRVHANDGEPAAGATVCADPVATSLAGASTIAGSDGRFTLGPLAPGEYDVFYHFPDDETPAASADRRSASIVRVRVADATSHPLDLFVR